MTPEQEQDYREEARQLRQVGRKTQREIIALHRSVAADPKVKKGDRDAARRRADALERLLGLRRE
jgi:hypothetical protein